MTWKNMDTAPKGGGAELVTDEAWVEPPLILVKFQTGVAVVCWDWYYAPGGNGHEGHEAWVEPVSGELAVLHYGDPIGWRGDIT